MRLENIQLQNQKKYAQTPMRKKGISPTNSQKQSKEGRGSPTQSYSNKLTTRQFIAVVTAVAAGLTIMGVGVISLISSHLKEHNAKISEQKTHDLSSTPILIPAWARKNSLPVPARQTGRENSQMVYNLKNAPSFKQSDKLQAIVNDAPEY